MSLHRGVTSMVTGADPVASAEARTGRASELQTQVAAVTGAGLDPVAASWRELDGAAAPNVFLTYEWMDSWWRAFGSGLEPHVIVVRDADGTTLGIAPFVRSRSRVRGIGQVVGLRFMGFPEADRLGIVSRAGHEAEVAAAVADHLRRHRADWHVIELTRVLDGSPALEAFTHAFGGDHLVLRVPGQACPFVQVDGDWPAYVASRRKRFRSSLRRDIRRFTDELGGRIVSCTEPPEVHRALTFLFEYNARRFGGAGGEGSTFADPRVQAFHLELATRLLEIDRLDLSFAEVDGEIVAVDYNFRHAGRLWGYNAAFDTRFAPFAPGKVLLASVIERAFTAGASEYDFLLGDDGYKRRWTTGERWQRELRVVRRRLPAIVAAALPVWWAALKRRVRATLPDRLVDAARRVLRSPGHG